MKERVLSFIREIFGKFNLSIFGLDSELLIKTMQYIDLKKDNLFFRLFSLDLKS